MNNRRAAALPMIASERSRKTGISTRKLNHQREVAVTAQANAIHEHAVELASLAPEGPNAERQEFLSYAYNLDVHARDIKSIVELLIQHDQDRGSAQLGTDHLREALAAHYGGMVTMCVACHNRFRQTVVK